MKQTLSQTTKPGETYIQLGHMIKNMVPGDRMPPFSKLLKQLGITQRSLDIAYARLKEEGVLELKKQSGVFVRNPYAGGTFLFVAAEDVFLSYKTGENLRLYFAELRRKINSYFPGSRLEIVLTESPDMEDYDREPQLRKILERENNQKRLLGALISYRISENETKDTLDSLDIPYVDFEGDLLRVHDSFYDVKTLVEYLKQNGYRRINILSSFLEDDPQFQKYLKANSGLSYYSLEQCLKGVDLVEGGIKYIKELIDSETMPEAFAVCDDYFCQGILLGAYMKGIKIEDDYGLITVSQQGVAVYSDKPLKRLNYCWSKIANVTLDILRERLLNEEIPEPVIVRPELEV